MRGWGPPDIIGEWLHAGATDLTGAVSMLDAVATPIMRGWEPPDIMAEWQRLAGLGLAGGLAIDTTLLVSDCCRHNPLLLPHNARRVRHCCTLTMVDCVVENLRR